MPWDAIGNLILGFWKSRKAEKWAKALIGLALSALITFLCVWGASIVSLFTKFGAVGCLVIGFGTALLATSATILMYMRRVEQFKDIAIWFPAKVEEAAKEIATQYGAEFDPNKQKN